jgi:hypothetical protein
MAESYLHRLSLAATEDDVALKTSRRLVVSEPWDKM